jgi:nicotinamidase-related amidase
MVKTAVLVIDMIKGMEEWIPKKEIQRILPNVKGALASARAKKVPVIYVVHTPLGKKGTKIYDEIKKQPSDFLVKKECYSSFYNTSLERLLKRLKIKRLVLIGVSTHWCILSTALDASYRGYEIVLLQDCTVAPTQEWKNWAIKWMEDTFDIGVTTSKSVSKFLSI